MFLNYKAISFIRGMGANHYLSDIIKNKVKRKTKLPFLSCIKLLWRVMVIQLKIKKQKNPPGLEFKGLVFEYWLSHL